jgi:hypothetical protein
MKPDFSSTRAEPMFSKSHTAPMRNTEGLGVDTASVSSRPLVPAAERLYRKRHGEPVRQARAKFWRESGSHKTLC